MEIRRPTDIVVGVIEDDIETVPLEQDSFAGGDNLAAEMLLKKSGGGDGIFCRQAEMIQRPGALSLHVKILSYVVQK
jgi:hypothetical protein